MRQQKSAEEEQVNCIAAIAPNDATQGRLQTSAWGLKGHGRIAVETREVPSQLTLFGEQQ